MKILTVPDMLKLCGTTRRQLLYLMEKGSLPYVKVGKQKCCVEEDFNTWLRGNPQHQKTAYIPRLEPTLDSIVLDLKKTLSQVETLLKKQNSEILLSNLKGRVLNPIKPDSVDSARAAEVIPINGANSANHANNHAKIEKNELEFRWKT